MESNLKGEECVRNSIYLTNSSCFIKFFRTDLINKLLKALGVSASFKQESPIIEISSLYNKHLEYNSRPILSNLPARVYIPNRDKTIIWLGDRVMIRSPIEFVLYGSPGSQAESTEGGLYSYFTT